MSPEPLSTSWMAAPAQQIRWLVVSALLLTIPAFYLEMQQSGLSPFAPAAYLLAATGLALGSRRLHPTWRHPLCILGNVLIVALVLAALLPSSARSTPALTLRMITAMLTLAYLVWSLRHLLDRGSLPALLALALTVLLLCGVGFWWLEPRTPTLAEGLWLAFTTAATVGYGDIVPSTPASQIFSVFVVLLGYGVLMLTTAAIAATWVESSERKLERDILSDLHAQVGALRQEIALLRTQRSSCTLCTCSEPVAAPLGGQGQQTLEDQRVDQLERQV
ncbi:MAG: potassium channel family protein [Leptothrix sp. (in: b-proteobacteria)]